MAVNDLSSQNVIADAVALEARLTEPRPALIDALSAIEGDILILGAGGKMGPTLATLAAKATAASGSSRKVIAVSSWSKPGLRERLESAGVHTIAANLLEPAALEALPDAANLIYMVGRKFGSSGAEWSTWTTNVWLAGQVARRFIDSRVVMFSSGNIYPFVDVTSGGATEAMAPAPVGEYAMSCLGRERMFDHAANELGAKVLQYRLNYAVELRYGVLLDVAKKVWRQEPIDLSMGYFNCVWQGYANEVALRGLALAASPPAILNVTGPETVSVRALATQFGKLLDREPQLEGQESGSALLSNASKCFEYFGKPEVTLELLTQWTAAWVRQGGDTLDKPTHFETRDGKY